MASHPGPRAVQRPRLSVATAVQRLTVVAAVTVARTGWVFVAVQVAQRQMVVLAVQTQTAVTVVRNPRQAELAVQRRACQTDWAFGPAQTAVQRRLVRAPRWRLHLQKGTVCWPYCYSKQTGCQEEEKQCYYSTQRDSRRQAAPAQATWVVYQPGIRQRAPLECPAGRCLGGLGVGSHPRGCTWRLRQRCARPSASAPGRYGTVPALQQAGGARVSFLCDSMLGRKRSGLFLTTFSSLPSALPFM